MKKHEIRVGGLYLAKVSGAVVTVRVDEIEEGTRLNRDATFYNVTNLKTGRKTTFRSAAKFRGVANPQYDKCQAGCGRIYPEANKPWTCIACAKAERERREEAEHFKEHGPAPEAEGEQRDRPTTPASTVAASPGDTTSVPTGAPACSTTVEPNTFEAAVERDGLVLALDQEARGELEDKQGSDPMTPTAGAPCATSHSTETASAESAAPNATVPAPAATMAAGSAADRILARIAARRAAAPRRTPGTPLAGMTPNDEQESILDVAAQIDAASECGRVLVIAAGAGAGKTATLKMLEQILSGRGQYTAFNKSLVQDAKPKFKRASCNTTHSLGFGAVGKQYAHRLEGPKVQSYQIAQMLGIKDMILELAGPTLDRESEDWKKAAEAAGFSAENPAPEGWMPKRTKHLKASFLAGQVMVAIKRFRQTADREISAEHFKWIDGIDDIIEEARPDGTIHKRADRKNQDRVRTYLLPHARAAWCDLARTDGSLPFSHDDYVKIWQLGEGDDRPVIGADYILLDEYQDTAMVFLDILMKQTQAFLILVGDDNQRIYEWRGAVNAGDYFPGAPRRLLSQSYRFGQAIADVANAILGELEEPTDLIMKGNPAIPSRVAEVDEPRCYLYRTNAGAVSRVMRSIVEGRAPHLIGGGGEVVAWCQAAVDLQAKRPTSHPDLACFESWAEVVEYSKTDEGEELRLMVKLVTEFGAAEIRDALKCMPKEADADEVVSTAHKSKGREWPTVKLGPDFPAMNRMTDADLKLLYVAATRAQHTLDISACPPFCGEEQGLGEARRFVSGLEIAYTQPMPSAEAQAAWLMGQDVRPGIVEVRPDAVAPSRPTPPRPAAAPVDQDGDARRFTWAKHGDAWCARGPKGVGIGARVMVERRDGSTSVVTIRRVVREYDDATIYGI